MDRRNILKTGSVIVALGALGAFMGCNASEQSRPGSQSYRSSSDSELCITHQDARGCESSPEDRGFIVSKVPVGEDGRSFYKVVYYTRAVDGSRVERDFGTLTWGEVMVAIEELDKELKEIDSLKRRLKVGHALGEGFGWGELNAYATGTVMGQVAKVAENQVIIGVDRAVVMNEGKIAARAEIRVGFRKVENLLSKFLKVARSVLIVPALFSTAIDLPTGAYNAVNSTDYQALEATELAVLNRRFALRALGKKMDELDLTSQDSVSFSLGSFGSDLFKHLHQLQDEESASSQ